MKHISKVTGRSYQIVDGVNSTKNESYDIKIIMDWDETTEEVPFIIDFYFGEYNFTTTEEYIQNYISKEKVQTNLLRQKLDDIILENNWDSETLQTKEQSRALFTAICYLDNIIADTKECDDLLWHLYNLSDLEYCDIPFEDFQRFMLELIV